MMRNIFVFIGLSILIFFTFHNKAAASEVIISGSSQFDSSLSAKFMEKHGYVFIEESYYKDYLSTNTYAAKYAEVTIENEHGTVLGTGMVDEQGKFSITVPKEDLYKVIVKFRGHKRIKQVIFPKTENVIVHVGFFKSEIVDSWMLAAALNSCDKC